MAQQMPVVRQLHWVALIPQFIAIAVIALATYVCFPKLDVLQDVLLAAFIYLIFCRTLRAILTRAHIYGIRAYRAQRFDEAISHFEASYQFFSAHRTPCGQICDL